MRSLLGSRTLWRLGIVTIAGMVLAVACGGGAQEQAPTPTKAPAAVATPTAAATATPTPVPAPRVKRGGIINTGSVGIPHVDISQSSIAALNQYIEGIYQRLITYRLKDQSDATLVGQLAESWEVADGGKTITLHLRKEAKWPNRPPLNGRPFTSADVAWNIDYYKAKSIWSFMWKPVTSYETPDANTIILHLEKPFAPIFSFLAYKYNYMLPKEVFEQDGNFKTKGIGTGPFVFDKLEEGIGVFSSRNDNYWEISELDGKPLPYADGWNAYETKDYATALARLMSGQVDIVYTGPKAEDRPTVVNKLPGLQVAKTLPQRSHPRGILINMTKKPWDDVRMRRAVSYAIDKKDYIQVEYSGEGEWLGPLPAGQTEWAWSEAIIQQKYPYDPEKARALIKEAGYEKLKVVISHYTTPSLGLGINAAQYMAESLKQVGLDVTVRTVPDVAAGDKMVRDADFELAHNYWTRDDEPHAIFTAMLNAKWITPRAGLKELVEQEGGEMDVTKRKQLVNQIQEVIWEDMYWAPNATASGFTVRPGWAKSPEPLGQNLLPRPFLERTWLDK
ncbi:MAG: ABC transporter substrate-binding protein [Chloroflexi bacterium]|nr:ABC transporter substrate-binding protein [Chloroflexota bacterium]